MNDDKAFKIIQVVFFAILLIGILALGAKLTEIEALIRTLHASK